MILLAELTRRDRHPAQVPHSLRQMKNELPTLIAINHDDYHASHVGRTADGRQFFVTTPFVGATSGEASREFLAVHLFDAQGSLVEARIDEQDLEDGSWAEVQPGNYMVFQES
jgi:hypothetical protein